MATVSSAVNAFSCALSNDMQACLNRMQAHRQNHRNEWFSMLQIALLELHKPSAKLLTLLQAFAAEKCYASDGHAIDFPTAIQVSLPWHFLLV